MTFSPEQTFYAYWSKINLHCESGSSLIGESVVECTPDGTWKNLGAHCVENFCTLDRHVLGDGIQVNDYTDAQLETARFNISDSIVLSCPDGKKTYLIDEQYLDPTITCQKKRLWSKGPELFECKNVCSNPPDVESIDWQNFREWYGIGETVWYRCKSGFLHTGTSAEVHCDQNGQWSDLSNLCVKTDYPVQNIDLIFLLDGSGSVGIKKFETVKSWVKNITEHFDLKRFTKVGVVQYSYWWKNTPLNKQRQTKTEIVLGQFTNRSEFKNAVDGITLFGSQTYTAHAINKTVYDFENSPRFNDTGTKKVLLLLTDGKSNDNEYLLSSAEYVRSFGINTYAVGVSKSYVREELQIVANGHIGNDDRVFHAPSFENLELLIENITEAVTGTIGQSPDCTVLTSSLNDGVKVVGQSVDDDDKILISLHSSINFYCSETKQPFVQQQQYLNPTATCQNDRTWSIDPTDFVCKSICASASSMENGDWNDQHMREFYEVDEILWFTCDEEYTHTGSDSTSTCLSSGEWSVSSCRAIKK